VTSAPLAQLVRRVPILLQARLPVRQVIILLVALCWRVVPAPRVPRVRLHLPLLSRVRSVGTRLVLPPHALNARLGIPALTRPNLPSNAILAHMLRLVMVAVRSARRDTAAPQLPRPRVRLAITPSSALATALRFQLA
jgi:hypothetical protein